jgi:hypothetical protein
MPIVSNLKGEGGSTNIDDTNARTGRWDVIDVITAATFTTLTEQTSQAEAGGTVKTGKAWPAGTKLYGIFTAITLTSGWIVAYRLK